ncbi:unnamed protein product [Urochloa decumbens]|uniref:Knottins-like domain-containing protein n=1 Tax=Urochloa decumbens TaxID=240449 RepID=A0ABC9APM8_9POAL
MVASPKKLFPATVALLLLVIMAAEMSSVDAVRRCGHLSGNYHGWCWSDASCTSTCKDESIENIGGYCDDFPLRCYCRTVCPP